MLIVGLSTFGENPAACVVRDGSLVAFAEEERFVRIKGAARRFPAKALSYCLREAGAALQDVDAIAIGWDADKYRWRMPVFFARAWWRHGRRARGASYSTIWKELLEQRPGAIRHRVAIGLREAGHSGPIPSIEFVEHHLAHAASAYYPSGWDGAAILILDGSGEERASTYYLGNAGSIVDRGHRDIPDSLGWFYAAVTAYLGFVPYQDEGFVMGLAAYGRRRSEIADKMERILRLQSNASYEVDPRYTLLGDHHFGEHFSDQFVELLGPPRLHGHPIEDRHCDIAYEAQRRLELAALRLVRQATDGGRIRRLCLAGGVALNCKMNGFLAQSDYVDEVFVQPASHDAGTALGAALWLAAQRGKNVAFRMSHVQWGPHYTPDQIRKTLELTGARYSEPPSAEEKAAEAIAAGKVVAWFQGRMEVGPRALGGRSILADATRRAMSQYVNARVKHRDPWRPFCPSLKEESTSEYLERPRDARFMTVAYAVPEMRRQEIPAVVHVDGTTRPQTVSEALQPRYHRLLRLVEEQRGAPVVLNTSMNVKGEPMACTPADALRCYFSTGIDAMILEDFWLEKR